MSRSPFGGPRVEPLSGPAPVASLFRRMFLALFLTSLLPLLATPAVASASSTSGPVRPCNGSVELCSRTLDQVVLPGSHNSMSAEELGWNLPNHDIAIPAQLRRGARALLIDTYYGKVDPADGKVDNVGKTEGSQAGADLYLCHVSCRGGASDLKEVFGQISQFLRSNPREVLVFVNEDYVTAADFARVVEESGLIDHVYKGPAGPWPTLTEMVETGERVLFLAQSDAGSVPWYHLAYAGVMRETPYSFTNLQIDQLTTPAGQENSCRSNRGGNTGDLFLMNHWILGNGVRPLPEFAEQVNRKDVLVSRARTCKRVRGKLPTILAVDFFGIGNTVGAARDLNGVVAKPFIELAKPKNVAVRAGRTGVFRLTMSNIGTAAASGVRVCANVPARLARTRTCVKAPRAPANGRSTAVLRVKTKPRARGRSVVRFTASVDGKALRTTAALTVKPVRKRR